MIWLVGMVIAASVLDVSEISGVAMMMRVAVAVEWGRSPLVTWQLVAKPSKSFEFFFIFFFPPGPVRKRTQKKLRKIRRLNSLFLLFPKNPNLCKFHIQPTVQVVPVNFYSPVPYTLNNQIKKTRIAMADSSIIPTPLPPASSTPPSRGIMSKFRLDGWEMPYCQQYHLSSIHKPFHLILSIATHSKIVAVTGGEILLPGSNYATKAHNYPARWILTTLPLYAFASFFLFIFKTLLFVTMCCLPSHKYHLATGARGLGFEMLRAFCEAGAAGAAILDVLQGSYHAYSCTRASIPLWRHRFSLLFFDM